MSEKPFWEGKTGKEMAGLHVKVTWKNGTIVTGVLDDIGDIDLGDNRSLYMSRGYDSYCDFEPMDNIQSIELLDDPEYERIDDIKDVREGDIFVANDGNKYPIDAVDTYRAFGRCRAYFSYSGPFWLSNCSFAYALRPKPKPAVEWEWPKDMMLAAAIRRWNAMCNGDKRYRLIYESLGGRR